jgi:beta-glucanase (GH16 family)
MRNAAVLAVSLLALITSAVVSSAEAAVAPLPSTALAPAPGDCGDAVAKADGTAWKCTFDDEFNAASLDARKWIPITTAAAGTNGGGACFVDSPNNIAEADGVLTLTVRKEAAPVKCKTPNSSFNTQYTSGQVATYTKFSQTYGRFSVRAKFPATTVAGLQSALWLWPNNPLKYGAWPTSGEIDIAEEYSILSDRVVPYVHYLYDPKTVSLATSTNVATNNYCMIAKVGEFHDYTVEWTPTTITVLYDGHACITDNYRAAKPTTSGAPFDQPFFVALTQSLGVGVNKINAATPLPASTQIDYVRVWK